MNWSVEVSAGLSRLELPGQLQAIPGNAGGEQVVSTLPKAVWELQQMTPWCVALCGDWLLSC